MMMHSAQVRSGAVDRHGPNSHHWRCSDSLTEDFAKIYVSNGMV